MPEGHTIHRQLLDQAPHLEGHVIEASSPNRRFESGAAQIDGRVLRAMDAWGKNLFYFFEGRRVLHVHLGMDGRFRRRRTASGGTAPPTTTLGPAAPGAGAAAASAPWLRYSSPLLTVDLSQPKVCRVIDEVHQRRFTAGLGPDPLRADAEPARFYRNLAAFEGPVGVALLDQSVVAGIGNVYRAEVLFACRMSPHRPAASVRSEEAACLWGTAVRMLSEGVALRGDIVTVDPRSRAALDGRRTWVYGQRSCAICRKRLVVEQLAGRVSYRCPACQASGP